MRLIPGKLYEIKSKPDMMFVDLNDTDCEIYYPKGSIVMFIEEKDYDFIFLLPNGRKYRIWRGRIALTEKRLFEDFLKET